MNKVLIPFLAGLLFGPASAATASDSDVLIPFLAGLLFGPASPPCRTRRTRLNPLFGGSAFRTADRLVLLPGGKS